MVKSCPTYLDELHDHGNVAADDKGDEEQQSGEHRQADGDHKPDGARPMRHIHPCRSSLLCWNVYKP